MANDVGKVSVPQKDGTITLTAASGERTEFNVSSGTVSPKTQDEYDALLASVPGAKPASEKTADRE